MIFRPYRFPLVYIIWFGCFDVNGFKGRDMKSIIALDKNENLPSLDLRAHDGFCKRGCLIASKEVSILKL